MTCRAHWHYVRWQVFRITYGIHSRPNDRNGCRAGPFTLGFYAPRWRLQSKDTYIFRRIGFISSTLYSRASRIKEIQLLIFFFFSFHFFRLYDIQTEARLLHNSRRFPRPAPAKTMALRPITKNRRDETDDRKIYAGRADKTTIRSAEKRKKKLCFCRSVGFEINFKNHFNRKSLGRGGIIIRTMPIPYR